MGNKVGCGQCWMISQLAGAKEKVDVRQSEQLLFV